MTDAVLHQADPELTDRRLDLSRPELQPIMERYARPSALIVDGGDHDSRLERALVEDGWSVQTCGGPAHSRCPLLQGKTCELRSSADAAIVNVDADATTPSSLLRLRCAVEGGSPAVLVLEGKLDPPRIEGRHAVVGQLRSPKTIVETVRKTQAAGR